MQKGLYRIPEVAELCGFSRSFIDERINREELPVVRIGKTVRIAEQDLTSWIDQQRSEHT